MRAFNLAKALARTHDVTLVAVSASHRFFSTSEQAGSLRILLTPSLMHGGMIAERIASSQGWGPLDIMTRLQLARSAEYDIIQLFDHFPNVALPLERLTARCNSLFVSDWCDVFHLPGGFRDSLTYRLDFFYRFLGAPFRRYLRAKEVEIRRRSDAVTVISRKLCSLAVQHGIRREKITVIEGGVDTNAIKPLSKLESRKQLNLPLQEKIVAFLGRSQFDLDMLIRSFARLKPSIPEARLLILGEALYPWTKRLAGELGIASAYSETGYCPMHLLPRYLACADVFALPLRKNLFNETRWPNKIGEYLAASRPVVITDVGEVAQVVQRHKAGLVAEPNEVDFAHNLLALLRNAPLSEQMGENGRKAAVSHFSWGILSQKLEDLYRRLLDNHIRQQF